MFFCDQKDASVRELTGSIKVPFERCCQTCICFIALTFGSGVQPVEHPFGAPDTWLNNVGGGLY